MKIKRLIVKSFRGFTTQQEFEFAPVTILYGANGTGKSSTLNAIEWCLYGRDIIGKATGIRERIGWEIKNRNSKDDPYVKIEIEIKKEDGSQTTTTISRKSGKKDEEFIISDNDISVLLNKYSFKDFLTGVHQHQEAIRAILTEEPRIRNEAFDRLMGLFEYRNIADIINEIIQKEKTDKLEGKISNLENEIRQKVKVWGEVIEKYKKEIKEKEVEEEDISEKGEERRKNEIINELSKFMSDVKIEPTEKFKDLKQDTEVKVFVETTKNEIEKCRSEMPDVKKQQELFKRNAIFTNELTNYDALLKEKNKIKNELNKFRSEKGDKQQLEEKKQNIDEEILKIEKEKEQKNLQAVIIEKAIEFLKKKDIDKNICPVCGNKIDNLLAYLEKKWKENYNSAIKELDKKLKNKEKEKTKVDNLIKEFEALDEKLKNSEEKLKRKKEEISKVIGREIREDEDPIAILNLEVDKITNEIKKINNIVNEKLKVLKKIEEKVEIVKEIHSILELEKCRENAREIESTPEWKELSEISGRYKKFINTLMNIISGIKKASQKEAENKIKNAKNKIAQYFKNITDHPFIEINLEVEETKTGENNYKILGKDDKNVIPIMSQGHLNALALSIFLALSENLPFGFLMLDDPSQSLSSKEKEGFVNILNEISKNKNIIISTMDKELYELLKNRITKEKRIYEFKKYDLNGPEIEEVCK